MSLKQPLSPQNALRLLDLLCADDAFRNQFQSDPSGTLEHHELQAQGATRCAGLTTLASKEEFQAARLVLQQQLTQSGMFTVPHYFEAGSSYTTTVAKAAA